MDKNQIENWLINLYNTANEVAAKYGDDVVKSILFRYNAASIDELHPSDYENVFGDLYLIATDN